ncbi:FAD-binding protein [Agromyces bauzanensis]
MSDHDHFDLVVIGCGAAGLSAALSFVEEHRRRGTEGSVAILERSVAGERGGATRWSWVNVMIGADGALDRRLLQQTLDLHDGFDLAYFDTLEARSRETLGWLTENGVEIAHQGAPFAMSSNYGAVVGGGRALIDAFAPRIEASGRAAFLYETEAVRLSTDAAGCVDGVHVRDRTGTQRFIHAGSVLIATGGFEGSAEALTKYVGPRATQMRPVVPGIAHNVGDGLRMGMELGAATAGQFDQLHVQLIDARTRKPDAGIFGVPYGIIVDQSGERFADEGETTFERLNAPLAWSVWRDHDNRAFFVYDSRAAALPGFEFLCQTDIAAASANSIEELAAQIGLEGARLARTVDTFNTAVQPGDFDPTALDGKRTAGLAIDKSNWAMTIAEAPFFAIPVSVAITFSFGGLRSDTRSRVVTADGVPIPNLYAAGVATGVWYEEYPGALSVFRAVTYGRIAGAEAAAGASSATTVS